MCLMGCHVFHLSVYENGCLFELHKEDFKLNGSLVIELNGWCRGKVIKKKREREKTRDIVNPMLDHKLLTISSACIFFFVFFCYR